MFEDDLEPGDSHRVRAALGWLELGNAKEARAELSDLSEAAKIHPDVLEILWAICSEAKDWEEALSWADALVENHPERSSGWIHRAYSLRRVKKGGLEMAWSVLVEAAKIFPEEPIIAYNLSCYAAQFGRLSDAWDWFGKALGAADDVESIKNMALGDDDLKSLWGRIQSL